MEISFIKPSKGVEGSRVTIFGSFPPDAGGAQLTDTVTMAGVDASEIVSQNSEKIVAIAGAPTDGNETGGLKVVADTGAYAVTADDGTRILRVHRTWCTRRGETNAWAVWHDGDSQR